MLYEKIARLRSHWRSISFHQNIGATNSDLLNQRLSVGQWLNSNAHTKTLKYRSREALQVDTTIKTEVLRSLHTNKQYDCPPSRTFSLKAMELRWQLSRCISRLLTTVPAVHSPGPVRAVLTQPSLHRGSGSLRGLAVLPVRFVGVDRHELASVTSPSMLINTYVLGYRIPPSSTYRSILAMSPCGFSSR